MSKKIGFIGIGLMGLPMAKNILKSGFNLKAFNRSQNKAEPLKEFGAEITTSIDEVVKDCDVVITMLTDDTAINDVMDSPNFLENLKSVAPPHISLTDIFRGFAPFVVIQLIVLACVMFFPEVMTQNFHEFVPKK